MKKAAGLIGTDEPSFSAVRPLPLRGADADLPPEHFGKIERVGVAAAGRRLSHAHPGGKAASGLLHADGDQIFLHALPGLPAEQAGKITPVQVHLRRDLLHTQILLHIGGPHIVADAPDALVFLLFPGESSA